MGIDRKYGAVSTERGSIAADEPVFILRAQDATALDVLDAYARISRDAGARESHLAGVAAVRDEFAAWQASHFTKRPGPA